MEEMSRKKQRSGYFNKVSAQAMGFARSPARFTHAGQLIILSRIPRHCPSGIRMRSINIV